MKGKGGMKKIIFIFTAVILTVLAPISAAASLNGQKETAANEISEWVEPTHKEKIQHIRDVFSEINAKTDFQVITSDSCTRYIDNGVMLKTVYVNDSDLTLPLVECYYDGILPVFIYGTDGENEYRYYFDAGQLIREIGPDGKVIDYLDEDEFPETTDTNVGPAYSRGWWEMVKFTGIFICPY